MTLAAKASNYGSWISKRILYLFGFLGTIFVTLTVLSLYSLVDAALFYLALGKKWGLVGGFQQDSFKD